MLDECMLIDSEEAFLFIRLLFRNFSTGTPDVRDDQFPLKSVQGCACRCRWDRHRVSDSVKVCTFDGGDEGGE